MTSRARGTAVLDVSQFLARLEFGRFHLKLVVLCCLVTFFDGIDFGIIAYAAPYIRDDMRLPGEALGWVFSSSNVGQILGAMTCTYLADRIGRRPVIVVCALLAALLTIAMGFVATLGQLVLVRLLGGVALGGLLPVAWALNIEAMPKQRRATTVALIMFGFTLGGSCAGPLTNLIAPEYGWERVFILSGFVTLLIALVLLPTLPESVRFLVSRGAPGERVAALLRQLDPRFDASSYGGYCLSDERAARGNFRPADLFRGVFRFVTPLIWAAYFFSSLAAFLGALWGPIFFEELGMTRQGAALLGSSKGLVGSLLSVVLLRFTEARGLRWVALFPILATPVFLLVGAGAFASALLAPAIFVAMVLKYGGHGGVVSIIGIFYPSAIRSNAGGWANALGKTGGVVGPLLGALFVAGAGEVLHAYLLLGACTCLVALCVLGLSGLAKRIEESQQPVTHDAPISDLEKGHDKALV
jgi:AAHS family 4-hydroxybenzoate transporter-like MFS transporter